MLDSETFAQDCENRLDRRIPVRTIAKPRVQGGHMIAASQLPDMNMMDIRNAARLLFEDIADEIGIDAFRRAFEQDMA